MLQNVNWYGLWTLYKKEVYRFLKVYNQTLFAPMVNALLLLAVFSLAVGRKVGQIADVNFEFFMASGLIIMTIVQNAFANTSSSLVMGKVMGTIIDILIPPLSAGEITFAMTMAGITRGVVSGLMVAIAVFPFVDISVSDWGMLIFYSFFAAMMLSLLGLLAGILSETFDHMSALTSYVITPLAFLSGTFYSVNHLPPFWQNVNHFNPFFYMIDGFRYSMTGHADASIDTGVNVLIFANVTLYMIIHAMFSSGYRIKT